MGSAEVSRERVTDVERNIWVNKLAETVQENARLSVANEAIIARVREVEAEADQLRSERDRLALMVEELTAPGRDVDGTPEDQPAGE